MVRSFLALLIVSNLALAETYNFYIKPSAQEARKQNESSVSSWRLELSAIARHSLDSIPDRIGGTFGATGKILGPLFFMAALGWVDSSSKFDPLIMAAFELGLFPNSPFDLRLVGGSGTPAPYFGGVHLHAMLSSGFGLSGRYLVGPNETVVQAGMMFAL